MWRCTMPRDLAGLNRCVSSVFCVLGAVAGMVVVCTFGAAFALPIAMGSRVGQHGNEVFWVILFLGLATAIRTGASAHAGVLTGCHRWTLHNGIYAGGYAITVAGMIGALLLGFGIRGLALVYCLGETVAWLLRVTLAYRVCPGL